MATQLQKLFNLFMQQHYPELLKEMPIKDTMHDAYVSVYCLRRPYVPTPERFKSLMKDAYHRHLLKEFNHSMHFILPDPLFWFYLDENEQALAPLSDATDNTPSRSISDISAYSLQQLFAFVRKNFSKEVASIFNMAVVQQMSYADIAKVTGKSKAEVKQIINQIELAIRQRK